MSEMTSLHQWLAWIITAVLPSTAIFFHGTYRGAKSAVPRNTTVHAITFFERTYCAPKHSEVTIFGSSHHEVMWRHRSYYHSIRHRPFPIGCPLVTSLYIFKHFRDIRPQKRVRALTLTDTRRKWFCILSHATHCIGQTIGLTTF